MMNITKFFSFAIAILVLFSACNDNQYEGVEIPTETRETGEVTLSLLDATGVLTRNTGVEEVDPEAGTEDERKIFDLVFYIFDAESGARDTQFPQYIPTENAKTRFTFPVTAGEKHILVAINTGAAVIPGNYDTVKKALYTKEIATPTHVVNEATKTGIPMSGEVKGVEVEEGQITPTTIDVSRLYARFDAPKANQATVAIEEGSDEYKALEALKNDEIRGNLQFNLTGYIVVNGLKTSYYFPNYGAGINPDMDRWNPATWEIGSNRSNYTPSNYDNQQLGTVYSGSSFLGLTKEDVVYLYENSPKYHTYQETGSISGFYRNSVYAMIIEGQLIDNDGVIATRYWRINVSNTKDTETMFQIIRNAIYKVNINSVKTIGYETPEEAEEEEDREIIPGADEAVVEVTVKLVDWRVFEENTDI